MRRSLKIEGGKMPTYKVAHINQQGQNLIIFPLDPTFGQLTALEQQSDLTMLGLRAYAAGLRGLPVAVWEADGQTRFRGPERWRAFLESINLEFVWANVNKEISW
jgi:hypothetical protein